MNANENAATTMTIGSLAGELEHVAYNVWHRIESVGDALGGSNPRPSAGEDAPCPADLHSTLQRALTVLRNAQDQILRCEDIIGVARPNTAKEICEAQGQMNKAAVRRF